MRSPALRHARANSGLTFRPDANCVLWLPGQDDAPSATIRDRSGYGNDGTITDATWVRNSKGLRGLSFDGDNDYVLITSTTDFNITTGFTFMVWANPTNVDLTRELWYKGSSILHKFYIGSDSKIAWQYYDGSYISKQSSNTVNLGANNFCAVSCSISGLDFTGFVNLNGTVAALSGTFTEIKNNASDIYLGIVSDLAGDFLGNLFLHTFFTIGLTQAQVEGIRQGDRHLFGV